MESGDISGSLAAETGRNLLPADNALAAHCGRVATIAAEIARAVSIPGPGVALLCQAARMHHFPTLLLDPGSLARLLPDLLAHAAATSPELAAGEPVIAAEIAAVLRIFHCRFHGPANEQLARVAAILQLSDLLDEQIEPLAAEDNPPSGIWEGLEQIVDFTLFDRGLLEGARRALTAGGALRSVTGAELAPQAHTAREVFSVLAFHQDCETDELVRLATSDPVLAGRVIQVANSAIYNAGQRMKSVRQAIAYVGSEKARKVMLAVALEPVFAGRGMRGVWKHSLRAAQISEDLAQTTGIMDAEEALLLGLVHDIGRQVTHQMAPDRQPTRERLLQGGCPPAYVEQLFFGRDHGEVGAEVLRTWNFPEHLIEAVRYHHRPEASGALHAALVYLAEFWTGGEEDLPSLSRLGNALARTGVTGDALMEMSPRRGSAFELLSAA